MPKSIEAGGVSSEVREWRFAIEEFNAEYAAALDSGRIEEWPRLFTEDALYIVTGRDNDDAGLPVGLVYCEGRGMLEDRALAIARTMMFEPRYLLHQVTNVRVLGIEGGIAAAVANYALFETLVDDKTRILQVGRYHDRFVNCDGALRLKERRCVYDSLIIETALIYPV
jgi:anthranilate 1,2-dioxygenase small subunit